jgi:hypothetical protein
MATRKRFGRATNLGRSGRVLEMALITAKLEQFVAVTSGKPLTRSLFARNRGTVTRARRQFVGAELLETRAMLCVDAHDGEEHHGEGHHGEEMEQSSVASVQMSSVTVKSCGMPQPAANQIALTTAQFAAPQFPLADTFKLHSLSTATKRIYLDFDGHFTTNTTWQNYFNYPNINTPAFSLDSNYTSFSDAEKTAIQDVWARVAEDFAPFQVDVTTEDPGVDALRNNGGGDTAWGIRVVVGGDGAWMGSAGVAIVGGFGPSDDAPAFAFADQWWKTDPNFVSLCISHEVGHTLGLGHDGPNGYYPGHGSGATSWVPIMGSGSKSLSQWSKGEYKNADNKQDDLSIITTTASNGFGYRADDHGNTTGTATVVTGATVNGIVERNTDFDVFSFASSGTIKVKISPAVVGANLDILAEILDSNGNVLQTSNPIGALDANFNFTAAAGTYYLRVQGTGEGDPLGTGYTKYASLGQYTASFEGSSTPPPTLVIAATAADKAEGTGGVTTPFTFTVTRSGDLAASSTVSWAVTGTGANAASANDFTGGTLPTGTVTFAVSETTKTITVNVAGDSTVESDEDFTITLSSPTGATLGSPVFASGKIRNDDVEPPTLAIAATSANKPEGTGGGSTSFTFTVTRSGATSGTSSVSWAVTGSGTNAASANDFMGGTLPAGSVTFAVSETTKTITVNVASDSTNETDEGFTVTLASPSGATLGTPATASGTIQNDDSPPTLAIAATSASKPEGTGGGSTSFTFTVTRSGDTTGSASVSWAVTGSGTNAASANDFTGSTLPVGSVAFAIGETTKTITVNVAADSTIETDEGFTVTLASPSGATLGSPATASGAIQNDDFPPTLTIVATSASKPEGTGGGSTSFTFTVIRSGDTAGTSSVSWAVTGSGANAASANDFTGGTLPFGTETFTAGQTTKTITVSVAADVSMETDEGFTVTLASPSGATLGTPATASGTIQNDDSLPTLAIAATSASKPEGTGGGSTSFTFTVTRSGDTTGTSSVSWAVTGSGTNAASANDFTGSTLPVGSVAFAIGETTKTITVNVAADSTIETDEGFTVTLASPSGATLRSPATAPGTIKNDDLPALSVTDARVTEGNAGTANVTLQVTLSEQSLSPVTVSYAAVDGTAKLADNDYTGAIGSVTFAAGETSKTITLVVKGDMTFEADEIFTVRLSDPTGATIAKSTGIVTIANDDYRNLVGITETQVSKAEGNLGRTPFTFTLARTGSPDGDVTVQWAVKGSGPKPADRFDFIGGVLPSGTVRIGAGRQSQVVIVNALCDLVAEYDEQFTISVINVVGVGVGRLEEKMTATGIIRNDDLGVPRQVAVVPAQSKAFAAIGAASAPSMSSAIAMQAFAALNYSAGPTTVTIKRPTR